MSSTKLICDIFKGSKKEETYLYVARDGGVALVPLELLDRLGELELVTTIMLDRTRKLARADACRVMSDIHEKGFYLQLPPKIFNLDKSLKENNKLPR
jgi:uncharacterized protein YcgL (UPF0745 family)